MAPFFSAETHKMHAKVSASPGVVNISVPRVKVVAVGAIAVVFGEHEHSGAVLLCAEPYHLLDLQDVGRLHESDVILPSREIPHQRSIRAK
jgi:hypothetical protein